MAFECTDIAEHMRGSDRKVDGEFGGQISIGQPPDTIGAEQGPQGG